jgi:hypothetical protein
MYYYARYTVICIQWEPDTILPAEDRRPALQESLKAHPALMVSTEAGAEGTGHRLFLCSLVLFLLQNYTCPYGPHFLWFGILSSQILCEIIGRNDFFRLWMKCHRSPVQSRNTMSLPCIFPQTGEDQSQVDSVSPPHPGPLRSQVRTGLLNLLFHVNSKCGISKSVLHLLISYLFPCT